MKLWSIAKTIAVLLWSFTGLVFIVVGWSYLQENPSVAVNGDPANVRFAVGYTGAGILFLVEAVLTFFKKKLALILSIPTTLFAMLAISDQLNQLIQGSILTANYLIMYGIVLLMSSLTIAVVVSAKIAEAPKNA